LTTGTGSRRQTCASRSVFPRSRAGDPVFLSFLLVTGSPAGEAADENLVQKLGNITRSTAYSIWLQAAPGTA